MSHFNIYTAGTVENTTGCWALVLTAPDGTELSHFIGAVANETKVGAEIDAIMAALVLTEESAARHAYTIHTRSAEAATSEKLRDLSIRNPHVDIKVADDKRSLNTIGVIAKHVYTFVKFGALKEGAVKKVKVRDI